MTDKEQALQKLAEEKYPDDEFGCIIKRLAFKAGYTTSQATVGQQVGDDLVKWVKELSHDQLLKVFKKVSLLDLSKCEFEYSSPGDNYLWINALFNGRVIDAIKFDDNIFWMMNNGGDFSPLNPMKEAFESLTSPATVAPPVSGDDEEDDIYDAVRKYRDSHPEQPPVICKEVEEWISVAEYEKEVIQLLKDKPVIKMLMEQNIPFSKWTNNIHTMVDKELGATREVRVKFPPKQ